MKEVIINKAASEKTARFFPWVYDNDILRCPHDMGRGELVKLYSSSGSFLGGATSISRAPSPSGFSFVERPIDEAFLQEKGKRPGSGAACWRDRACVLALGG